jgi:hypothetical protein
MLDIVLHAGVRTSSHSHPMGSFALFGLNDAQALRASDHARSVLGLDRSSHSFMSRE